MSLREQLTLKDGKARPPALLPKVCVHNGSKELLRRHRGDMAFDIDFVVGRQLEVYTCVQCGYTISAGEMMFLYQKYMVTGEPLITGRHLKD